jgi:hypothetical protein
MNSKTRLVKEYLIQSDTADVRIYVIMDLFSDVDDISSGSFLRSIERSLMMKCPATQLITQSILISCTFSKLCVFCLSSVFGLTWPALLLH